MFKKLLDFFTDRKFVIYAVIGLSGVAIDFLIYLLLTKAGLAPFLASVISVSFGIINNFLLNAHFNFKKKDHLLRRFVSFYAVGTTGVILSGLFIILFHNIIGISDVYAKLISVPFIVVFQFWFNKNSSFADNHKQIPARELILFAVCISVLTIFAFNSAYFNFTDENDNLLGAYFIATGQGAIYGDYFSHHMPLAYFVGAPLFLLLGNSLIAVKVVYGILTASWLLVMSRHLLRTYGIKLFACFTLLVAVSQTLAWSHMLLAESLIAFAVVHSLILYITKAGVVSKSILTAITFAILGSIPVLSSLSYAPISLIIYLLLVDWLIATKSYIRPRLLLLAAVFGGLPYILFGLYLVASKSLSEFIDQALKFNTLYYSQFTPDAPVSFIDSVLVIIEGSFNSLLNAVTYSELVSSRIIAFLFSLSILYSLYNLYVSGKRRLAILFSTVLLFGASRQGFSAVFANGQGARAGIVTVMVGILLICFALYLLGTRKVKPRTASSGAGKALLAVCLVLIAIASLSHMSAVGRDYIKDKGLIELNAEPGSPSTIINIVNKPGDYYWLGPIDFSSQLMVDSKNISSYRFYAPWHAVCPECTATLVSDIRAKRPNVIAFDAELRVFGELTSEYADELISSFEDDYYQVSDIRMEDIYLKKENMTMNNAKLVKAGYAL